ncbi:Hypothetical protein PHPALM_36493 [Phytophthora palmivora]|uniref:Reverse transcriptase n=1 Tax=Phytophthora palmivora TaxID=4796 RepID=A0A2P4WZT8_9STRA|nr:Hypothetical protein PHPALM_36493 [Phytophthora palmivora]
MAVGEQRAADELLEARQHVADNVLMELQRKRRNNKEAMREECHSRTASLVHHSSTITQEEVVGYVGADDGLPTAMMLVAGARRKFRIDIGARTDRVDRTALVDYVEGIDGFLLDVAGVWTFKVRSVFDQLIVVEACIVSGCGDEFLMGVYFMETRGATTGFERGEVRYNEHARLVVIPFRTYDGTGRGRRAVVHMTRQTEFQKCTVTPVEVEMAAGDGDTGIFIPTMPTGAVVLAPTVTNGMILEHAINANGGASRLPTRKELGQWIPLDNDVELLEMNSELQYKLSDGNDSPLENESDVDVGVEDNGGKQLIIKLPRVYRQLTANTGDCPPSTALATEHHIDTADIAPIQAQSEDEVIEQNVRKMVAAEVVEQGNGAWGFPMVLAENKDGEARFCVDYRALNKVTRKDVYPLPRFDETLEALGGV